jgi:2-polyprenyl-3-methyl-5-hydroxy-6-metoxy-1,4-benzoquinol methylase
VLETLSHCPICHQSDFSHFLTCQDYTVSQEKFDIVVCKNCSFKFTNPRPTQETVGVYYESEDYISHSDTQIGLINRLYHWVRRRSLRRKLGIINQNKISSSQKLLDYGCGTGAFASFCQQNGWNVSGIEPNSKARQLAETQLQKPVYESIENISENLNETEKFDVITLWHVLEHIHQLSETLSELKKRLSTNGKLIIAVPNPNSDDAKRFKQYWAAYDLPRHLWHFSQKNIQNLMETQKMQVKNVFPLYYDSFYISLLSSKYQTGKTQYFRAIWSGLSSNIRAVFGKKEFSSLIYVIENK